MRVELNHNDMGAYINFVKNYTVVTNSLLLQ